MTARPSPATAAAVVFVHVHYPEIWREMAAVLARRMNVPFRLVLTTSHPEAEIAVPDTPRLLACRVLRTENRGRDILPFLRALATEPPFAVGLKLHTKKSPQREDGSRWRTEVLDSLVPAGFLPGGAAGPGTGTDAILRRMAADPRVGFVTPAGFALSVRDWVLVNRSAMERVMAAAGSTLAEADLEDAFFAAGSMFWFRRAALAPLAAEAVLSLFEPEEGQFDGTAAHATERLFPVVAKKEGFVSLAMPALEAARPEHALPDVLAMARRHADIPSTYFAAPARPPEPPAPVPGHAPPAGARRLAWLRR